MSAAGEQARTTRRYDRLARFYDLYSAPMERLLARKRRGLLARARGRVLEVGVGTGRSFALYPEGVTLVGIDVAPRMLERARRRAAESGRAVELQLADVQELPFADDSFDTATAACVFCSVPDPVRGLAELRRVVKPGGEVLLLEHVRPEGRVTGRLADVASPVARRLFGPSLNRRTEENVAAAGLQALEVKRDGIWREIVARPPGEG